MTGIVYISRITGATNNLVYLQTTDTTATAIAANYILNQAAVITALTEGGWTWEPNDFIFLSASNGVSLATISSPYHSLTPFAFSTTVVGTPVVVGDFAVFSSTSGNIEDLGYLPSNAAYTNVVMANVPTIANYIPIFNDTAGSITDSAYSIASSLLVSPAVSALTAHSGGGQTSALALTKAVNNITTVAAAGDSVRLPASAAGLEITVTNSGANSMQVYGAGTDTINGIATGTGVAQLPGQTVVYTAAVAGNWLANVSGNPNPVLFASVPMTLAQFAGMYAAPYLLVATPGSNKMIAVEKMEIILTYGSAALTAGGVVAAQYDSTANGAGVNATNSEAAADFFVTASTMFQFVGVSGNTVGALPFSTCANKGLYLSNLTQAFATGTASAFVVKVYYRIINLVGAL